MHHCDGNLIVGRHYPAIDGLRGLAVLLVVWFHSLSFVSVVIEIPSDNVSWVYYIFSIMGETGVDLFFVLSGFLITGILIDTRNHKHKFRNFYIRRVLRIFPLYYSMLLLFLVYFLTIFGLDETSGGLNHGKIAMYLLYLQNWLLNNNTDQFILMDHTWSLAVEEQFYLLWPLVFWSVYKADKPHIAVAICCAMILLSWILRLYLGINGAYKWAYTFTPSRLDVLSFGALLSIFCHRKAQWLQHCYKFFPYIISACFIIITIIMFAGALQKGGDVQGANNVSIVYGLIFFSVMYAGLLAYVFLSPETNILKKVLSTKPIRSLGKVSYGMYLFHTPVMIIMIRFLCDNTYMGYWSFHIVVLFCGGGLSFVLALLSYNFYEKRFLRLKDKLAPLQE